MPNNDQSGSRLFSSYLPATQGEARSQTAFLQAGCYTCHPINNIRAMAAENVSETTWKNAAYLLLVAVELFTYSSSALLYSIHACTQCTINYSCM